MTVTAVITEDDQRTVHAIEFLDDGILMEFDGGGHLFVPMGNQHRGMLAWALRAGIHATIQCATFDPPPVVH